MARILGYIAASLDGFIADSQEGLDWLFKAEADLGEHHYEKFLERIRTVVMGRTTYEWMVRSGAAWPYSSQRSIVVTSRPLTDRPAAEIQTRHDVDALISELRALDDGDVWMLGGGKLQMAFMERGALDELEIYIASAIIGGGHPLFPPTGHKATPRLLSAKSLGRGMARLHYAFD